MALTITAVTTSGGGVVTILSLPKVACRGNTPEPADEVTG